MSSAASRVRRFSHNASLQNLIQRHLLRSSASAPSACSVTHLLNAVTVPRMSSQFNNENPVPYSNTLQAQKASCTASGIMNKYNSDCDVSMIMFGLYGVDQHGNVKIHTRRRCDFDEGDDDGPHYDSGDFTSEGEYNDVDDYVDVDDDGDENFDDEGDENFDDEDDFDKDSTRKRKGKF